MTFQTILKRNRSCVFIDSSNPNIHNRVIDGSQPIITLPFPPLINPHDLVVKSRDGKIPARVPNAFIIYRKVYIETARSQGYILPMTVISSIVSRSWERENEIVKAEYKRLAKEAFNVRNEMLPKANRKRRREKWNIVTFKKSAELRKSPVLKAQNPTKKLPIQIPSPISSPEPQSDNLSPVISQTEIISPQFNFEFTQCMFPSPEIPEMTIGEMIINNRSSPDSSPQINDHPSSESYYHNLNEASFNSTAHANNDIQNEHHLIDYGCDFSSFNEFIIDPETLDMSIYSGNYIDTEPSSGLGFDFSYYY
ncbi:17955_t:CDS:1 [Funneliformis geosporum]|uniref:3898_t:CDS:1 n=1 Tax=Funneliformis geosporum TaxID=1117311 RepID=A0A9W4SH86_9GLOM|nr:17955_t:CDS:1 [Funneliformis geosporum]CAI2168406.1 3898_t:CDS:1 [Funneliformis geosporum]